MNRNAVIKIISMTVFVGAVMLVLISKTTWSLSDEKPGPKMIECIFRGLWSPIFGIRIVTKQSCGGM